jgi:hypothetical protein
LAADGETTAHVRTRRRHEDTCASVSVPDLDSPAHDFAPIQLPPEEDIASPERILEEDLSRSILECLEPQLWEPRTLPDGQTKAIVAMLQTSISALATSGHTLYLHEMLYKSWQPAAYQDSCSLAALYTVKTRKTSGVLISSISNKILDLIANSASWTLTEHLAAVQALIIYQIMRLFDADLGQQELARKQNALLELWTALLWKRSFGETVDAVSPFDAWVFQESLRRTVLMSVFVRGAWGCVTMGGLCDQVPVLARLLVTKDVALWGVSHEEWMERTGHGHGASLISYGDLSYTLNPDGAAGELSAFERLLLVACKGEREARCASMFDGGCA